MSHLVTPPFYRLRRISVLLFWFAATVCAHSQSPTSLTGTLTIRNPTNQLADYSNPIGNQLALNLTAGDPEFGNRTVRLKLYIEQGNTLYASGTDVVVGASNLPLPLNALQRFNSTQLAPYFRLENLQGLSGQTYQSGLPEGLYRFTFEVIDASPTAWNGNVLGRISEQFWVTLNDPPLLNAPSNGENLAVLTTSAGINFGWIPRWTSANTRYVFTLVDFGLNSNSANVYQQFMSLESVPLYRSTPLSAAMLSFGTSAGFPTLIAGRTYGWRVQATGGAFKKNGYSEIFVFKYSGTCAPATGLTATAQGSDAIAVRWNASGVHSSYRVQYRKRGTGDANLWRWFETTTTNNFVTLAPLEANTTYEIKLGGVCASDVVSYGTVITCQTAAITSNPNCGQPVSLNITNTAPLASLRINDTIRAAEIPICVTKVSGANGVFTGEGFGRLPWTGETKIKVKFTSVGINTDKRLITGNIETVYDPKWGNMLSIDGLLEGGQNVGSVRSGLAAADFTVGFGISSASNISCNTATGTITITGANGQTQTLPNVKLPTTIQDNQGRIYGVSANGTVTLLGQQQPLSMTSAELNNLNADKGVATFLASGTYAFDAYNPVYEGDILWRAKYEKIGDYGVARKAAAPGKPDVLKVNLRILDNTLSADNVKFMNSKGLSFTSRRLAEAGMYELDIVGGPGGDAQEIYALHPKANETGKYWSLGKILVASYTPQKKKLVLIPVKGATTNPVTIKDKLNDVYKPIGVEWDVIVDDNFTNMSWDLDNDQLLKVEGSGLLSTLTDEMKALNNLYEKTHVIDYNTQYIFVMNGASNPSTLGDMPRGKKFGYIFLTGGTGSQNVGRTVAHEIGHGRFTLQHTFNHFNKTDLSNNLMNDGLDNQLSKYQWDIIHDPGVVIDAMESDRDAMSYWVTIDDVFLNNDATFSFLTYTGQIITLPKAGLKNVLFHYGISQVESLEMPMGVVQGFTFQEGQELVTYSVDETNFNRYVSSKGKAYSNLTTNSNLVTQVTGFVYPLPSLNEFVLYHFPIGNRTAWVSGQGALQTLSQFNLVLFEGASAARTGANGQKIKQVVSNVVKNSCLWCMHDETVAMTSAHKEQSSLIYVAKIAQIRAAFPEYFDGFTSSLSWQNPVRQTISTAGPGIAGGGTSYSTYREIDSWEWGRYLNLNTNLRSDYLNNTNVYVFFSIMYNQLLSYIRTKDALSKRFWQDASDATTAEQFVTQLTKEAFVSSQNIPYDKRKIALRKIFDSQITEYQEDACIKLIASIKDDKEKPQLVEAIACEIGFEAVFAKFNDWGGKPNFTRLLYLLNSYMEKLEKSAKAFETPIAPEPYIVEINRSFTPGVADNLYNFEGEYIRFSESMATVNTYSGINPGFNGSTSNGSTPVRKSVLVRFNEEMPVLFTSHCELGDMKFEPGDKRILPALLVAMLSEKAHSQQLQTGAWLAADAVFFALGAGEIKVLIHAASYTRRAVAVANLVSMGTFTASHVLNGRVHPKLIKRLENVSLYTGTFGLVGTVGIGVKALILDCKAEVIRLRATGAAEDRLAADAVAIQIDNMEQFLNIRSKIPVELIDDLAMIVGEHSASMKDFVKAIPKEDGLINVVVHGSGNNVLVTIDGIEYSININLFAEHLSSLKLTFNRIRLLSCGSEQSARDLSRQMSCEVQVCEGDVLLYRNGKIVSGDNNLWKKFTNGGEGVEMQNPPTSNLPISDAFVTLSNLPGRISRFRNAYQATHPNIVREFNAFRGGDAARGTFITDFKCHTRNPDLQALQNFERDVSLIESWQILERKPILRKQIGALTSVSQLRQNPMYRQLLILDDIVGDINSFNIGTYNRSFVQVIDRINIFLNRLPNSCNITNINTFLGRPGLGNGQQNSVRSAYVTLEYLIDNSASLANTMIEFEVPAIVGSNRTVTDVVVTRTAGDIYIETKAGDAFFNWVNSSGTNFCNQSYNMLINATHFNDVKFVLNSTIKSTLTAPNVLASQKRRVINAWKNWNNGAILNDLRIQQSFGTFTGATIRNAADFETVLIQNDNWFDSMFNNNNF